LIAAALIGLLVAIYFGLPMTGLPALTSLWLRLCLIGAVLIVISLYYGIRWWRNRRAAADLEENLMPERVGDGAVLAERMDAALEMLKRSGGKNYLYDLPWYIIIGPPGVGKTTALRYSGIDFPGQDVMPDMAQGFGGTRNCDWWFAEDAILIDTAGRYVTQDSDAEADSKSWSAFLDLLKTGRPDQPVNGVILAFSVEDIMRGTEESLAHHARTMRARLAEIHAALRIDFPVYVLFTKADLISGFREYFASFNQSRRNSVWGVTFQTRDRRETTYDQVSSEFDALLSRLSDEAVDRMNEEPDPTNRISVFGFPGQMAMLKTGIRDFLQRVFEPTRYKTNAILRGFYFTSGTQEGTPIDQVLGNISRGTANAGHFMSGKGKSFFLRDLLQKVIFAERDWVNYDQRAVWRVAALRGFAMSVIALATIGSLALFGYSFSRNMALVREASVSIGSYRQTANAALQNDLITDPDPTLVLGELNQLSVLPGSIEAPRAPNVWEGFGLSRHADIALSTEEAYATGLERLLRPRMMLHLQEEIPQLVVDGKLQRAYQALKVYLHLGGVAPENGDDIIIAYFEDVWQRSLGGSRRFEDREDLLGHVEAMLRFDEDRAVSLAPDPRVVEQARNAIAGLSLEDRAWATIEAGAFQSGLSEFSLVDRISGHVRDVFRTIDGSSLDDLRVPALFTYQGYWGYFVSEVPNAEQRLRDDAWVLGEVGERADMAQQLAGLEEALFRRYRDAFQAAWGNMLAKIGLVQMTADAPRFDTLGFASNANSPILELIEAVDEQTRITRLYDELAALGAEDAQAILASGAGGSLGQNIANAGFQRLFARSNIYQRVVLDYLRANSGGKISGAATVGDVLSEDRDRRRAEMISQEFVRWHRLLEGERGAREADGILQVLAAIWTNRTNNALSPRPEAEAMLSQSLNALSRYQTRSQPEAIVALLGAIETQFRSVSNDATLQELNQRLTEDVALFCRDNITGRFPFAQSRIHLAPSMFGQFFRPGGIIDKFYDEQLQPHVMRTVDGLVPDPKSQIGERLDPNVLEQFERALRIQQAFFAGGGLNPEVRMSVKHLQSSSNVGQALLELHGRVIATQPGGTPAEFSWPGGTSGVSLQLFGRNTQARFPKNQIAGGSWAISHFLRGGRRSGNVLDVTKTIGDASITYRFEFDSPTVPFLMQELAKFQCPVSLD
jgi:type VI secretion system protein ImpL